MELFMTTPKTLNPEPQKPGRPAAENASNANTLKLLSDALKIASFPGV
jgi:hypothetical protein